VASNRSFNVRENFVNEKVANTEDNYLGCS